MVITPTARTVNSTAEYSCNEGYRLDNGDTERTCQAEGTWSGEAPQCCEYCCCIIIMYYTCGCFFVYLSAACVLFAYYDRWARESILFMEYHPFDA